jgi:hypothetical protein
MSERDIPEVRALITGAWLCADCVTARTGLSRVAVYETMNALAAPPESFRTDVRRCDRCLRDKVVHRIG